MSGKHTQGEMVFEDKRPSCNGFSLFVGDQYVAFIGDSDSVTDAMANSERMAACWNACQGIDTADLNAAAAELERQHAEIERLTAENKALRAKMELVDYVLQDNLHNRLTPRVVDIAYSAFASGRGGRSEDGEPCDWFNDTKPRVVAWIDKIKKDLAEEAAHGIGEKP